MPCPRCGAQNSDGARFCSNCGQLLSAPVSATRTAPSATNTTRDPNTAFVLEVLLGLFGFLGIGWVYAGKPTLGIVMLVSWWLIVGVGLGGSVLTGFIGCCLWLPVHFVVPLVSAMLIRNEIEQNPWG